ncbi:oligoribonuclease [Bifidobacterium adolescentis]|nr:oligoribonuclease [Bifidobacterium adolescentis]
MMSEEKAKEDMLLWMDVETTGLDPDHDRILEVEMRCTDMRGVRCVGGFRRVIGLKGRKASITDGNLEAWRMHCANGLLEGALDGGYTEEATANALEEYVDSLAQSFTLHPAGSNPQFDLDFIGRLCPNLPLHYHRIDMATLRDSLEAAGWDVKPEEETPAASAHRTSTCLDRDIRQYARIIRHLSDHPVRYVATEAAR